MDGVQDFLMMGGYASFVWPAFALSAAVLAGVLIASLRALRRSEAELAALGANAADRETENQTAAKSAEPA